MTRAKLASADIHSEYAIEPMSAHDLLEVVELEEACRLSLWGWDSYHDELSRPEAIMLVARRACADQLNGKSLSGFISARVSAGELHINNIGVHETSRRRGIGSVLLRAALARGQRLGAQAARLEVRAGNVGAQSLYRQYGFAVAGRRRHYYRDPSEDALLMSASLECRT